MACPINYITFTTYYACGRYISISNGAMFANSWRSTDYTVITEKRERNFKNNVDFIIFPGFLQPANKHVDKYFMHLS